MKAPRTLHTRAATAALAGLIGVATLAAGGIAIATSASADSTTVSYAAQADATERSDDGGDTDGGSTAEDDTTGEDRQAARADGRADVLAPLVSDGTLTQEQADAVSDALIESGPQGNDGGPGEGAQGGGRHGGAPGSERGESTGGQGRGAGLEAAAEVLGLDAVDLRAQLAEGDTTLAEIAAEQGVDPQAVIDALSDEANQRITSMVQDGRTPTP
ncbi:MAG: hypothetical protein WA880_16865 [Ornithinimicrobium sp.]